MAITKNLTNTPKKTAAVPGGPPAPDAPQHIAKHTAKGPVKVAHPPSTPRGINQKHPTMPQPPTPSPRTSATPTEKVTVSTPQKRAPK